MIFSRVYKYNSKLPIDAPSLEPSDPTITEEDPPPYALAAAYPSAAI